MAKVFDKRFNHKALTYSLLLALCFVLPQGAISKANSPIETADGLLKKKRYTQARVVLTNYLKQHPNNSKALYLRSQCYEALALDKLAVNDLTKLINLNPKVLTYRLKRGERLLDEGDSEEAILDLEYVRDKGLRNSNLWHKLGLAYRLGKKPKQAIVCYTQWLKLEPKNAKIYRLRGRLYQLGHKYNRAINDFSKSISLESGKSESYVQRGSCYFALNQNAKAKSDFSKAIELGHKSVDPFLMRAKVYDKLGKKELAAKDRKTARVDDYEIRFRR